MADAFTRPGSQTGTRTALGRLRSLRTWCQAIVRSADLDEMIASGHATGASVGLYDARCRQLVASGRREALAAEIRVRIECGAVDLLERRARVSALSIDLRRAEVWAARRELSELADALVATVHPLPRGVALAMLLVRDARSPLYAVRGENDIAQAADAARLALTGAHGPNGALRHG